LKTAHGSDAVDRSLSFLGGQYPEQPGLFGQRAARSSNQMPGFQGLNEFTCVGKDLRSGYGEFLPQGVRNLIEGIPLLQQFPDSESDRVETETDALLDI